MKTALQIVALAGIFSIPLAANSADITQLQEQKNSLHTSITLLNQVRQDLQENKARIQERLNEADTDLAEKEKEMVTALAVAKIDIREKTQRDATLASIIYNRELVRTERLSNDLKELSFEQKKVESREQKAQAKLIDVEKQLAALQLQKSAPAVASSTAQTITQAPAVIKSVTLKSVTAPASATTSASTPLPTETAALTNEKPATWPSIEDGRAENRAFARAQLFPSGPVDSSSSIFYKVKIVSSFFGTKTMDYKGGNLYVLIAPAKSGQQKMSVFNRDFWYSFEASEQDKDYVFVYDANSLSNPELHIFPKSFIE